MILDEIANPAMTRDDVAQTYAILIHMDARCDWSRINEAIIKRLSGSALEYIKRRAWRMVLMCPWNEHPEGGDKDV